MRRRHCHLLAWCSEELPREDVCAAVTAPSETRHRRSRFRGGQQDHLTLQQTLVAHNRDRFPNTTDS